MKYKEYVFADTLKPKTFFQKILNYLGFFKVKLEDHQVIIERPTFDQLGLDPLTGKIPQKQVDEQGVK